MCSSAFVESNTWNEPLGLITALMTQGVKAVVASRDRISGEDSQEWMNVFYRFLFDKGQGLDYFNAYFCTMREILNRWQSPERVGKFVFYGI